MNNSIFDLIREVNIGEGAETLLGPFCRSLPEPVRRSLGRTAADELRSGSVVGDQFGEILKRFLTIPGFRDVKRADPQRLAVEIAKALAQGVEPVCHLVLAAWRLNHGTLEKALKGWAASVGREPLDVTPEDVEEIRRQVPSESPPQVEINASTVPLMALCLAQWPDSPVDDQHTQLPGDDPPIEDAEPWSTCLKAISDTAPDSPAWGQVEDFIHRVREISSSRAESTAGRLNLADAIATLQSGSADDLSYLQLHIEHWSVEHLAVDAVQESSTLLADLEGELRSLAVIRARTTKTFADEQTRNQDLANVHLQARAKFDRLDALLSGFDSPPVLPAAPVALDVTPPPTTTFSADFEDSAAPVQAVSDPIPGDPLIGLDDIANETSGLEVAPAVNVALVAGVTQDRPSDDTATQETIQLEPSEDEQDVWGRGETKSIANLSHQVREALLAENGRPLALIIELQRQWMAEGHLLPAYIGALFLDEDRDRHGEEQANQAVPSWLCQFALQIRNAGALQGALQLEPAALIPLHTNLTCDSEERQRLFLGWLCAGLVGEPAQRTLQVAATVDVRLISGRWLGDSALRGFCVESLLEPARRGEAPQFSGQHSATELQRRRDDLVKQAQSISGKSTNYRNRFVVRYWTQVVGPDGPVQTLLIQARKGAFLNMDIPSAEELASRVRGWNEVLSTYRHNILNRLDAFLEHLRQAAAADERLRVRRSQSASVISVERATLASMECRELAEKLLGQRCPSASAFVTVADNLALLLKGEQR